ncbi:MAG: D-TA family PLP-dependent enzyme [Fuerstiella sp.]|nr:D-TA family PLP-dependent enzyme [Fuerstiella sp.]MCP4785229.1 D-TA family PLP-dependent enzyme [Fuerstiella sp.]MCP4853022.1 D-TA family PLP-dependent enzyme [Fuerstiella sp.]
MEFTVPDIDSQILESLHSPSLVVFADQVRANIDRMIATAGSVDRLRPHCKTHKMSEVVRILLQKGITRHKAATVAEVEMLADAGADDIAFAYNPVGPNIARVVELLRKYPGIKLSVTADHPVPLRQLSAAVAVAGVSVGVMLDVDVGLHRTGVAPDSDAALQLYQSIGELEGLTHAGFHVYDGHQHQKSLDERRTAVLSEWPKVLELKARCEQAGLSVPELLCGGTPTFPVYAELDERAIQLSPGTGIFHDVGYGGHFPDLNFVPAAAVVTRVISRPTPDRITLDLGNKSVAADPPKGQRVYFPALPTAAQVIHNEEHLVLETADAEKFQPGDVLLGIPTHICPTSALHQDVAVIDEGKLIGSWDVTARNRRITI